MVLLLTNKNSNATKTILFEFILYPPLIKNAIFVFYAIKFYKITQIFFVTIYVQSLLFKENLYYGIAT